MRTISMHTLTCYRRVQTINHNPHSLTRRQITTTTLPPEYGDPARHGGYYDQARANSRHYGGAASVGYSYLRLIWDENGLDREVSVRYNQSRPGFWLATHPAGSASAADPSYQIFTGTLQVMKAVENHLVITFCQTFRSGELFSILLTRKPNTLTNEETHRIRSMLKRRGLNTASVRKVCASGASSVGVALSVGMMVAVAVALIKWH